MSEPDALSRLRRTIARRYTRSRANGYEPTTASVGLVDLEAVLAELESLRPIVSEWDTWYKSEYGFTYSELRARIQNAQAGRVVPHSDVIAKLRAEFAAARPTPEPSHE